MVLYSTINKFFMVCNILVDRCFIYVLERSFRSSL